MKIRNKMFKIFMAFTLCMSGMMESISVLAADPLNPLVEVPNDLNMDIKKLTSGGGLEVIDVTQGYALSDLDNGRMVITYQAKANTVGNVLTLTLPYFYSFKTINDSTFYTNAQLSSVNNGANNQVVLNMNDNLSNHANPETVSFDFSIEINRNSITKDKEAAWVAGTWSPDQEARDFIVAHNSNTPNITKTLNIVSNTYSGAMTSYLSLSTLDSWNGSTEGIANATSYSWGSNLLIWQEGGGFLGGVNAKAINYLKLSYQYPDIYTYSPSVFSNVTYTVTLPEEFEFGDWKPSVFSQEHATVTLSLDKKVATIKVSDYSTSAESIDRVITGLEIKAIEKYRTGTATLPSNTAYTVEISALDNTGSNLTIENKTISTLPYTQENMFSYTPNGSKEVATNKTITKLVDPKENGTANPGRLNNSRFIEFNQLSGSKELASYGKNITVTQTYDANLRVYAFYLVNITDAWNYTSYLAGSDWDSYTYTTNKNPAVTVVLDDSKIEERVHLSDPDEYITSISISYSKYAYIGNLPVISEIAYRIPEKNMTTGDDWQINEDIPIITTVKDGSNIELANATSYIRIKDLECPPLTMGQTPANADLGVGEYANNQAVISGALYLHTPYVGTPTYENGTPSSQNAKYSDTLKNPVFTVGASGGSAGVSNTDMTMINESIITNGKVNFSSIMGTGNWKVTLKTQSAVGAKAGTALQEYTVDLPTFSTATQVDLSVLASIPSDEYIVWFTMKHTGDLDIKSLSNYYTDENPVNGKAVDKTFFTVETTNYDVSPLSGQYNNRAINNYVHVTFDNCTDIDHLHDPSKKGFQVDSGWQNAASYNAKGAEAIIFNHSSTMNFGGTIQQGGTKTLTMDYTPSADVSSSEAKLMSSGSESFYFQLGNDAIKYLSFDKASVDGVDASSEIVTIDGKQYLKITNPQRSQYEKKITADGFHSGIRNRATFEPYKITVEAYTLPTAPTASELNIFTRKHQGNGDLGNFIEWNDTVYQEYTDENNIIIRNAVVLSGQNKLGSGANADATISQTWVDTAYFTVDDYVGLYKNRPATQRHFMTYTEVGYAIAPNVQALQGIVLNPGVAGSNQEASVQVKPWDEHKLTTSLSAIAGQSTRMEQLSSTIALPRKGDITNDGANQYTTDVDLYLSGPIRENISFHNPASTKPVILYSTDDGNTFVDEAAISDWSKVTHFSIYVEIIEIGDGCTYTIDMETDDSEENLGNAYMEAVFKTANLTSRSNRMNNYKFVGYEISGTAWDDANEDGMIDPAEAKLQSTIELYQNYGKGSEKLIATTTADANGAYTFEEITALKDLTLVSDLPSKKTATIVSSTTDNKFVSNGKGQVFHTFTTIDKDQIHIDYGVRNLQEVIIGGTDTTTAITGKKTISGSLENIDITKDQFTFNITANENNPEHGTENIPTTITNDAGAVAGADLSFTGTSGWSFTKEGTYTFTLTEIDPALKGHTYDQSSYEVSVVVSEKIENGKATGKLQQTTTIAKDGTNITIGGVNFANIAKVYKVNYDSNGGQPALIPAKTNVNWNEKSLLPANDPTRIGYTFDGWEVTTTTKTMLDVTADDTYATLVQDDDTKTEITLTAKWTKNEYQVSWVSEDVAHGTLTPTDATENVLFEEFATTAITVTPNVAMDQWAFTGWAYNYLPDGLADVPANYITGVTQDYKLIEVKGNIVFTAQFSKKSFVNVDSEHGYVAISDGTTLPTIPENDADKTTNAKIEYDENDTNAKSVAIAFENQRHYHLEKVIVSDLYGNEKIIYTNVDGETADTTFTMKDSDLTVDFLDTGSLKISNIKNSLNVKFTFVEDEKYGVKFYTQSKVDVNDTTTPYATNDGLYSGDEYGAQPTVNPSKEGFAFSGWSTNGTTVNYKATDKIADEDVSVYAIWNQKAYLVKYNLNGGYYNNATLVPDYTTSYDGEALLPTDTPKKAGYTFDGWYYNGTKITDTTKYKDLVANDTVNSITLSAKWNANSYQVEFDKNADKASGSMISQVFAYGEKKALSISAFTQVGYTFAGWATSADGTVKYADGEAVENLSVEKDGTLKLFAIWNANGDTAYTVEHYKQQDDGTWGNTPDDIVNASGLSDTQANAILKSNADAGYESYIFDMSNSDNILKGNIEADGSLVLKVYYKQVLSVSFDVDGGTPNIATQEVVYGEKATNPSNPTKEGYIFKGWMNTADNSTWDFNDKVESNMILKAVWEKIETPIEPETPVMPESPEAPETPRDNGPATGDKTAVNSMFVLMGASLFVMLVAKKRRKKQEN